MARKTRANRLKLLGGSLCLDFVNTVDWRLSDHPDEYLTSPEELLAWALHTRSLARRHARRLAQAAERSPANAARAVGRAIALREALYRVFSALACGRILGEADLAEFNSGLSEMMQRGRIVRAGDRFNWEWGGEPDTLDRVLWPVAWSAAKLLTSRDVRRVKLCPGPGCGWLFLDASRNHTRRWCDMEGCGNRAKARRHYERTKGSQPRRETQ